ncbi:limbic system-associated membrane protein isoform X2 [Dendroctonus ponderosae]|uniref:Ig-like domain-containing protein n=1 Tax=Dendroctonus ponderosae TaxID=77166 RepID=A0AAR5QIM7_DENPD|nr:limbic system-associated membrane protein isoform X2 [Dendroctonus ponderosae]
MRFLILACIVLACSGLLTAGVVKKDVKTKDEEDIYGDLDENDDIQKDQVVYYDDDNEEDPDNSLADITENNGANVKIISAPNTFDANIGEVVRLPCLTTSTDDLVRVWSKDSGLIYQGNINTRDDDNYKLIENGTLEVTIKSQDDTGNYACKVALTETNQPEVVHHVLVRYSPNITALFVKDGKKVVNSGDTVTLTCQANGYPQPKISWYKGNEKLVTEGESLTVENIKPKNAGSYRCLADNNIGRPAHNYLEIFVNHGPIVSVEKYLVQSDHEEDAELVCDVKAYPNANVVWQRNDENIISDEPKITFKRERNNERNILIIKNLTDSDFGQYSCMASNTYGKQTRNIKLVKLPLVGKFVKEQSTESSKDVHLQWKVESRNPITKHEIQYRRKGETKWESQPVNVTGGEKDSYLIKSTLEDLKLGSGIWETRARSLNSHGWSDFSDIAVFQGAKHGSHHAKSKHSKKEPKEERTTDSSTPAQHTSEKEAPLGESTSSSISLTSSLALIVFTILANQAGQ